MTDKLETLWQELSKLDSQQVSVFNESGKIKSADVLKTETTQRLNRRMAIMTEIQKLEHDKALKENVEEDEKKAREAAEEAEKAKLQLILFESEQTLKKADDQFKKATERAKVMYDQHRLHHAHNELFEQYNLGKFPQSEVVLQLASLLDKIEKNKITLGRLIKRRKKLDAEILEKTGGKGITEYERIVDLYDVKKLNRFLKSESLTFDSDEEGDVSEGDSSDEDMPKITTTTDSEGIPDVKIENFVNYISRLRKRAVEGNEKLVINFKNLEQKYKDMLVVQQELKTEYLLRKELFDQKYTEPLQQTKAIIREYSEELATVKRFMSKGQLLVDEGKTRQVQDKELTSMKETLEAQMKQLDLLTKENTKLKKKYEEAAKKNRERKG